MVRAKTVDFERGRDPKEAIGIGREAQMLEYFRDKEVYALIDYLDELPQFEKYRNPGADYDDAHYEDVPMDLLAKIGITSRVLDLIYENIKAYEGWITYDDPRELEDPGNKMSCGGGA